MKKLILALIISIFATTANAVENNTVLNLKTDNSYIIPLKNRPQDLQNSNTKIVNVDAITGITAEDSSILITTFEEGISYITFKENDIPITIKLLIDNKAEQDKNLMILDKPEGIKK